MRPDEHKKRKNAQYKKTHGIQSGQKKGDDKNKKTGDDKSKKPPKQAGAAAQDKTDRKTDEVKVKTSDDESEQMFQRRQIVSNWSRYEELPSDDEDEIPMKRGEDINKLLAETAGAAAQFRFKDELDWDMETESGETSAGILALNLQDIAESLDCIPLYERLAIPSTLFTDDHLNEMNETAEKKRTLYSEKLESEGCVITSTKTCPVKETNETKTKISESKVTQKTEVKNNPSSDGKPLKAEVTVNSPGVESSLAKNVSAIEKSVEMLDLEEDLDLLLSSDVNKQATAVPLKTTETKAEPKRRETSNNTSKSLQAPAAKAEEENLEDWLDSMLDE